MIHDAIQMYPDLRNVFFPSNWSAVDVSQKFAEEYGSRGYKKLELLLLIFF